MGIIDRLTYPTDSKEVVLFWKTNTCTQTAACCDVHDVVKILQKLSEYENTGLTPEEIAKLKSERNNEG